MGVYVITNGEGSYIHRDEASGKYGFHFIKSLVWDKGNKIMGQYYMSQFEYILFFRKGKGVKINNCGTSDILKSIEHASVEFKTMFLEVPEDAIKLYIDKSPRED